MKRPLLVVGQSHVAAFGAAARLRREADPDAPRTRVIHTRKPEFAPELADDGPGFGQRLVDAIVDQVTRHRPLVVSVNGGNAHNVLALMRHDRPFDFRLSGEPSPPLDPDAELLVESLVETTVARHMTRDFVLLRALCAAIGPVTHLESPPPIRDDSFISAAADAFFRDRDIATAGIASAGLRYRIWRLAARLMRAEANALGCSFLPVPDAARDEEGFLRQAFAADATHGNAAYADLWIEALAA